MGSYMSGTALGAMHGIKVHKAITLSSRSLNSYRGKKTGMEITIMYGLI